jgi:hypothetical protein
VQILNEFDKNEKNRENSIVNTVKMLSSIKAGYSLENEMGKD